jgi:hypothetical protein
VQAFKRTLQILDPSRMRETIACAFATLDAPRSYHRILRTIQEHDIFGSEEMRHVLSFSA